ncbi:SDR family oxidoreductase [Fibrella arboris]|uniref:SDR family oxidoreductase n=1 Tax=Fibrella arboris TaxID=3242486 RepID=UPI0035227922
MAASRICVITGANSGIGKITAQELARKGFSIVMLCRDMEKGQAAQQEIQAINPTGTVDLIQCDVASIASVRAAANELTDRYDHVDVLINNAGLYIDQERYSPDGYELTFATNHLGAFLLTNLLLDLLRSGEEARVITISSEAHRLAGTFRLDELARPTSYSGMKAYGKSKLCNILFANELAHRLMGDGITSNSVHPGAVNTNFGGEIGSIAGALFKLAKPFMRTPEQGAETSIYLASSSAVTHVTGLYFADCKPKMPAKDALNNFYAKRLWDMSAEMVGL